MFVDCCRIKIVDYYGKLLYNSAWKIKNALGGKAIMNQGNIIKTILSDGKQNYEMNHHAVKDLDMGEFTEYGIRITEITTGQLVYEYQNLSESEETTWCFLSLLAENDVDICHIDDVLYDFLVETTSIY